LKPGDIPKYRAEAFQPREHSFTGRAGGSSAGRHHLGAISTSAPFKRALHKSIHLWGTTIKTLDCGQYEVLARRQRRRSTDVERGGIGDVGLFAALCYPLFMVRHLKALLLLLMAGALWGQPDFTATLTGYASNPMAVPDFRGPVAAQPLMTVFNQTLWDDLDGCGLVQLKPKTLYPKAIPQQPQELGMAEWALPPVSANYIVMGYTGVLDGQLVLYGWLVDVRQSTPATGTVLAAHYNAALDESGARKDAHEFAADIIRKLGGTSLLGTKIYFTSDRAGEQNVWVMDADGSNQHQETKLTGRNKLPAVMTPAVSADGSNLALMTFAELFPKIYLFSLEPAPRRLPFRLPGDDLQTTPSFTPDGKQLIFSWHNQIYLAGLDGSHPRRISSGDLEVEPKINPKTGNEIAFVSGRSGHARLYQMNMDGADVVALSSLVGEAGNPSWHPNGQTLAYSCTKGIATAGFHICIVDVATQNVTACTTDLSHATVSWGGRGEKPRALMGEGCPTKARLWGPGLAVHLMAQIPSCSPAAPRRAR
jgi:TolB protein